MNRVRLFLGWYRILRDRGYTRYLSAVSAIYNSKYYNLDGKVRT